MPSNIRSGWLFPSGAFFRTGWRGVDYTDPPDSKLGQLTMQRSYWQIKTKRAENDFHLLKLAVTGKGKAWTWDAAEYGEPPRDVDDRFGFPVPTIALQRLKAIFNSRNEKLEEVEDKINSMPEVKAEKARRSSMQQYQSTQLVNAKDYASEAEKIEL